MASFAAPAMLIGSAVSAAGKIKAGRAEEKMYDAKASQTLLQGDAEAARYKQQGADILTRLNENLATLINRSGATGSGNISAIFNANLATASTDYGIAQDNIILAKSFAEDQAHQYRVAGDAARRSANISAIGTLTGAAFRFGTL
tara:strand:+ start:2701 stop:3135 length:435 start_codon:yes stop_codon:yes gene_type:complete